MIRRYCCLSFFITEFEKQLSEAKNESFSSFRSKWWRGWIKSPQTFELHKIVANHDISAAIYQCFIFIFWGIDIQRNIKKLIYFLKLAVECNYLSSFIDHDLILRNWKFVEIKLIFSKIFSQF
jgi:hypothetical protein